MYNETDDATRSIQRDFKDDAAFGAVMVGIYEGKVVDFAKKFIYGLSYYNPYDKVSFFQTLCLSSRPLCYLLNI